MNKYNFTEDVHPLTTIYRKVVEDWKREQFKCPEDSKMSYDQWKTASPYDDEPDVIAECNNLAEKCQKFIDEHTALSDLTREERNLLESCRDTLRFAADEIAEL